MTDNKNLSKDSVRRKGVTKKIEEFFFKFPHSTAKPCCDYLKISYKKYKQTCWRIKSETKRLLEGKVEGRVHVPLKHREEMRVELSRDVVDSIIFEASRRRPGTKDPKPFDEWYVTPNRNRMMLLRNDFVTIRVWPKTGTCRVLLAKPMPYDWVKNAVQNALFKAGLDVGLCEKTSETLEPKDRTRIFKVGPVTPFKIDFYKDSLGIPIKADGSHPDFIEIPESWPTWIKPLLTTISKNTEALNALRTDFPNELGKVTSSFEKSMQEHLNIIKTFRDESEARAAVLKKVLEVLEEMKRKRKRRRKRKPKPKTRWQKFRKRLRFR